MELKLGGRVHRHLECARKISLKNTPPRAAAILDRLLNLYLYGSRRVFVAFTNGVERL